MTKVIGLKLPDKDKNLIKQIEDSGLSNSELLRKALKYYFEAVNQPVNQKQQERNTQKINKVNHTQQEKEEKTVNQVNQLVNHKVQVTENYELMEYLKRDHEWLKDRIEHFENTQDLILAKLEIKPVKDKSSVSWVRM